MWAFIIPISIGVIMVLTRYLTNRTASDKNKNVIRYPGWVFYVGLANNLFWILLIISMYVFPEVVVTDGSEFDRLIIIILILPFFTLGVIVMLLGIFCKIELRGEDIIYIGWFGKKRIYKYTDICKMLIALNGCRVYVVNKKHRAFEVPGMMVNAEEFMKTIEAKNITYERKLHKSQIRQEKMEKEIRESILNEMKEKTDRILKQGQSETKKGKPKGTKK